MKSKIQDSRSKRGVFYYLIIGILFGSGILCLGSLVGGCGSDTQTATTTTTTTASTTTTATATTTTTVVGSITLSGTLNSGSISSAGVKVWAAVSDYSVVAIDNISGKSYHASTDATGAFSLSLPSTASYEISLVNSDAKYFGPMVMVGGAVSTEVVMGVRPVSDASLGDIVVDASKGMAKPATEPLALASFWDTAEATAGTPKGTLYCGKERLSGIITREGSADMDRDGIPDIFDADEDDDGIRKGIISTFRPPAASETVEAVFISSNIWALHGNSEEAKDQIAMWLNVTTPNDAALNLIETIEVISVPSTIKDVATIRFSSSIGDPIGYPAENSLWKDSGYFLYKTTTLPRNQFIVSLCPHAIMNVGDTFTIRVTYTDGSYQDFFVSTAYVLTDWSKIISYNGTTMPSNEGTQNVAVTTTASSLEIVFSKPLDEDGNVLDGLTYSIIVGTTESTPPFGVPTNRTETRLTDGGGDTITAIVTLETLNTYYITPVAESADGQRNGEQTWFTRE